MLPHREKDALYGADGIDMNTAAKHYGKGGCGGAVCATRGWYCICFKTGGVSVFFAGAD